MKIISKKSEKLLFSDHQKPVEKVNENRISEVRIQLQEKKNSNFVLKMILYCLKKDQFFFCT